MPHALKDMTVEEVSLVGAPANPGAVVLLAKNKDGEHQRDGILKKIAELLQKSGLWGVSGSEAKTFDETAAMAQNQEKIDVLARALSDTNSDSEIEAGQRVTMMQQSLNEFMSAVGAPTQKSGESGKTTEDEEMTDLAKMTVEQKEALLKSLNADKEQREKAAAEELAKSRGAVLPDFSEAITKAVQAAVEPIAKQLTDAQAVIAKMTADKENAALIEKAAPLTKELTGVKAEDVAALMKNMDADGQEKLSGILKAAGEQAKVGRSRLFRSAGFSGGVPVVTKAEDIAKQRAAEIVTKSAGGMTEQQAIAKVYKDDPGLYEQYESEQGRSIN